MGVRTLLARLRAIKKADSIVECRHCGTTVTPETDECPACGGRAFAQYDVS